MRNALVFIFLLCVLANVTAQSSELKKDQAIKFGINIGLNYSNAYAIEELPNGVALSNGFGFRLEVLAESRLTKRIAISPKMGFSFNEAKLNRQSSNGEMEEILVLPLSFELGTQIQFKKESANSRPYFFVGPSIKIPIQEKIVDTSVFASTWTPAIDFGMCFDKDFGYFQFYPELRYSIGLLSVYNNPNFSIHNFYFHNVSLVLNFLG